MNVLMGDQNIREKCSVCDAEFSCGASTENNCWCFSYPFIMPVNKAASCLCQSCLNKTIAEQLNEFLDNASFDEKLEMALKYQTARGLHSKRDASAQISGQSELIENIDYTIENGNYVFSAWYHLKRGSCCDNGCRNCPYGKTNYGPP